MDVPELAVQEEGNLLIERKRPSSGTVIAVMLVICVIALIVGSAIATVASGGPQCLILHCVIVVKH